MKGGGAKGRTEKVGGENVIARVTSQGKLPSATKAGKPTNKSSRER